MPSEIEPVFVAQHPALDFLNTRFTPGGVLSDCIADGPALLSWLVAAELITAADATRLKRQHPAPALNAIALEARKLRDWATAFIARWAAAPSGDYDLECKRLNTWLARGSTYQELSRSAQGFRLAERAHTHTGDAVIALLASQLARLVAAESPALIRRCAGSACTLWFLDRTKAHRRAFCSPALCGNRAKVAAFRERNRRS